MNNPNAPYPPPVPVRKGRGCMFYGCMTLLVLLLFAAALVGVGVYYVKSGIETYTDTAPAPMPKVVMTEDEFTKLAKRVAAFDDALEKNKDAGTLVLNEREINAIIQKSPKAKDLADHLYVTLKGDEVSGLVSVPLTKLDWLKSGRYLNGQATFKVSLTGGVLSVTARDIKVRGSSLPETFMSPLRAQNLAPDSTKSPETAKSIEKLESIEVADGTVTIKAKPAP